MTPRPWSCCTPIVARGLRRGRYRQLYLLHNVNCWTPLLRRQTVCVWTEDAAGRWRAA
jgi:hypothetical protein